MFKLQQIAESTDFGLSREAEEMYQSNKNTNK